jgi:hypothetical protein
MTLNAFTPAHRLPFGDDRVLATQNNTAIRETELKRSSLLAAGDTVYVKGLAPSPRASSRPDDFLSGYTYTRLCGRTPTILKQHRP